MDETPGQIKIKQLTERLLSLHTGLEEEKQSRIVNFQSKFKSVESKLENAALASENRFKLLKEQVGKLADQLGGERNSRELLDERKGKELKLIENNLQIDLSVLKQARKDYEVKATSILDDRVYKLRLELAKEKKSREELEEAQSLQLEEHLNKLADIIKGESEEREKGVERLEQRVVEELLKPTEELQKEGKIREETHRTLQSMIDDMQSRLLQELATERQEREASEETLLRLLEETCNRVEGSLRAAVL